MFHYMIKQSNLHERFSIMQFFVGFATATLIFIISLCLYVFFNEENKKRYRKNILPGHEFYVHRIGEIKVKSVIADQITYSDMNGEVYTTDLLYFSSFELTPLAPAKTPHRKAINQSVTHKYYTKKGKTYDV